MNIRESIKMVLREESKPPISIRRRFTQNELDNLMRDIETQKNFYKMNYDDAIYKVVRDFISSKNSDDIDGDDSNYWLRYVSYEMLLVNYVTNRLYFID